MAIKISKLSDTSGNTLALFFEIGEKQESKEQVQRVLVRQLEQDLAKLIQERKEIMTSVNHFIDTRAIAKKYKSFTKAPQCKIRDKKSRSTAFIIEDFPGKEEKEAN